MSRKKGNGIKVLIIGLVLIAIVLGYYYYLSNKSKRPSEEDAEELTAVQEMLLHNFDQSYPPTPKEVVKYFGEISQCFYNETYSEEEFEALAQQIQKLYDEELIANKTQEQYMEDLRSDVDMMKEQSMEIASFSTSSSADVETYWQDGYEWARLYCDFILRQGVQRVHSNEVFLLRKDGEGHWKIYGWTLAEQEEGADTNE